MKTFWWIIGIITTLYVRIWIINNSFKNKKIQTKTNLFIFILSLLLVSFLYFYKDLLGLIWLEKLYFLNNTTLLTICLFIFYCLTFLILLTYSLKNTDNKNNKNFIIVSIALFVWIWIGGIITWINTIIMYHLISCYAEEILKFSVWENTLLHTWANKNDLVLFSIISALWFSVIENIFYLIILSTWWDWNTIITMWRSIFTTLLHIVTTWLIAFFIIKKNKKDIHYRIKCLVWIIFWFTLHWCFNLSLAYNHIFLTIIILIICYFILTYILFNTDSIYKK